MSRRARVRLWHGVGSAALGVGAVVVALVLDSDHAGNRTVNAILVPLVGWSFAAGGLVAWTRRPTNGTGRLLLLVAATWFAAAIEFANDPAPYAIGQILGALPLAVFVHLLLAYPSGRLPAVRLVPAARRLRSLPHGHDVRPFQGGEIGGDGRSANG